MQDEKTRPWLHGGIEIMLFGSPFVKHLLGLLPCERWICLRIRIFRRYQQDMKEKEKVTRPLSGLFHQFTG
jgi:hypothetical protein